MRSGTSLSSLALMILVGCGAQPEIDMEAERNALLGVDRAWFEAYSNSNSPADVFAEKVADDGTLLPPGAPLAQGREAVREAIAALEAMPGFSVTWSPTEAQVGSGGDLGLTMGSYEMKMESPEGPIRIEGKYLTVWKKQADGTWMVTADMFNANGPPTPQM